MSTFILKYGIALNALRTNSGKETAFLLHHGMLGGARNLKPLLRGSSLHEYADIHLLDARNHGQSPHHDSHRVEDLAADLKQYIEKIRSSYRNLIVLGHSMGGLAVMGLTKHYPQLQNIVARAIIVDIPCNPMATKGSWSQTGELEMLQKASQISLDQPSSQIFRDIENIALDKDFADLLKFNIKISGGKYQWRSNLPAIVKHYKHLTTYTLTECEWRKPVEVIYGSKSEYFEEQQIEHFLHLYPQMNQRQNFHRVEGAGHWVHFQKKKEFLEVLYKILPRT